MKDIIDQIMLRDYNGLILVASNPVDILTYAAQKFRFTYPIRCLVQVPVDSALAFVKPSVIT